MQGIPYGIHSQYYVNKKSSFSFIIQIAPHQINHSDQHKKKQRKDMHRIKNGSEINFTFTWKFHPPNGCHKFNHTIVSQFFWYFFPPFVCISFSFHLGFHRHHHLQLTFFLRLSHLRFSFRCFFSFEFWLKSYFALKIYVFSPGSISYYYEFSKEQDYICSKPGDSGMHECTNLPPYRIGPMICNGEYEW